MGAKILLASDLSARCDRALDRAVMLAGQLDGTVILLHVLEKNKVGDDALNGEDIRAAIAADLPPVPVPLEIALGTGSAPATIARFADELECDIIVTGVARFNNISDFVLGTAVDHLVRHANVPVLIVKKRAHQPYGRLLVATDFSACSAQALKVSAELFPAAKISLLHAYQVSYEAWLDAEGVREEVRAEAETAQAAFFAKAKLSEDIRQRIECTLTYGDLDNVIGQAIRNQRPDMLVLGTHGKSGFVRATIGSHAAELLSWAPCDVLMVRGKG